MVSLPRQARDKHRENSKRERLFFLRLRSVDLRDNPELVGDADLTETFAPLMSSLTETALERLRLANTGMRLGACELLADALAKQDGQLRSTLTALDLGRNLQLVSGGGGGSYAADNSADDSQTTRQFDATLKTLAACGKDCLTEVRAISKPGGQVNAAFEAIVCLLANTGESPTVACTDDGRPTEDALQWSSINRHTLKNPKLIAELQSFKALIDQGKVPEANFQHARACLDSKNVTVDTMNAISKAAVPFCQFVINAIKYHEVHHRPANAIGAPAKKQQQQQSSKKASAGGAVIDAEAAGPAAWQRLCAAVKGSSIAELEIDACRLEPSHAVQVADIVGNKKLKRLNISANPSLFGKETRLLRCHFILLSFCAIILPRQARDKHRENSTHKRTRCCRRWKRPVWLDRPLRSDGTRLGNSAVFSPQLLRAYTRQGYRLYKQTHAATQNVQLN
jgi:hypothetical protein